MQDAACGDSPVDAALKTVDRITGIPGRLLDYGIQAVTIGKDAQGEVGMRVAFGKETVSGKAARHGHRAGQRRRIFELRQPPAENARRQAAPESGPLKFHD